MEISGFHVVRVLSGTPPTRPGSAARGGRGSRRSAEPSRSSLHPPPDVRAQSSRRSRPDRSGPLSSPPNWRPRNPARIAQPPQNPNLQVSNQVRVCRESPFRPLVLDRPPARAEDQPPRRHVLRVVAPPCVRVISRGCHDTHTALTRNSPCPLVAGTGVARAESISLSILKARRVHDRRRTRGRVLGAGALGRHGVHSVSFCDGRESVRRHLLRVLGRKQPRAAAGLADWWVPALLIIDVPDLKRYKNLQLTVSLAAPGGVDGNSHTVTAS